MLIKTNGRLALRYGTGLETLEIIGDTVLQKRCLTGLHDGGNRGGYSGMEN